MQAERDAAVQANANARMLEERASAAEEELEKHRSAASAARSNAERAEKDLDAQRDLALAAQEQLATAEERCRYRFMSELSILCCSPKFAVCSDTLHT